MENGSNDNETASPSPTVSSSPKEEQNNSRTPEKDSENLKDLDSNNDGPNQIDTDNDPFNLDRFIRTQRIMFSTALSEIQEDGQKQSCWLWFVLPTSPYIVNGVERGSAMNRRFALRSNAECMAYLSCVSSDGMSLRQNYVDMLTAIQKQLMRGNAMRNMFGSLDDVKAISSFRLFQRIAKLMEDEELETLCRKVLELATTSSKKGSRKRSKLLHTKTV